MLEHTTWQPCPFDIFIKQSMKVILNIFVIDWETAKKLILLSVLRVIRHPGAILPIPIARINRGFLRSPLINIRYHFLHNLDFLDKKEKSATFHYAVFSWYQSVGCPLKMYTKPRTHNVTEFFSKIINLQLSLWSVCQDDQPILWGPTISLRIDPTEYGTDLR